MFEEAESIAVDPDIGLAVADEAVAAVPAAELAAGLAPAVPAAGLAVGLAPASLAETVPAETAHAAEKELPPDKVLVVVGTMGTVGSALCC